MMIRPKAPFIKVNRCGHHLIQTHIPAIINSRPNIILKDFFIESLVFSFIFPPQRLSNGIIMLHLFKIFVFRWI